MRFEFITVMIYDHVISFLKIFCRTFRQETFLEHITKNFERFEEVEEEKS